MEWWGDSRVMGRPALPPVRLKPQSRLVWQMGKGVADKM